MSEPTFEQVHEAVKSLQKDMHVLASQNGENASYHLPEWYEEVVHDMMNDVVQHVIQFPGEEEYVEFMSTMQLTFMNLMGMATMLGILIERNKWDFQAELVKDHSEGDGLG
jgi:2-iminoacetate synthase ThiH